MPRISSGKRYARSAFELALEKNELEGWGEGLKRMAEVTKDLELKALLQDPRIPFEAKKDLLQKKLTGVSPLVLNLAILLVSKGIFSLAENILRQFNALLDAHRGVERARVTTALPLGAEEEEMITHRLGEIVDRKVVMDNLVDPSILGGFIARVRDTLIDGSVRQGLDVLKKNLVEAGK